MMKFNERYQPADFLQFLQEFLPEDFSENEEDIIINKERYKVITGATVLGFCGSLDLHVLEMDHSREKDPRVAITTDAFKILADNWIHRALVIFRNKDTGNYRFSYLTITLDLNDKDKAVKKYSNARRYSFYLGVSAKVKTAENFLIKKGRIKNYEDLLDRFNVEVVTKEFYQSYKKLFDNLLNHLKSDKAFSAFAGKHGLRLEIFTKKLLGQIVFLYFLQKKGWLGAAKNEHISKGDGKFLRNLFSKCQENNSNFFNEYLEVLFYDCLNSLPTMAGSFYREKFDCQIPFLNGGLFEPINDYRWQDEFINIPNEIFSNIENSGILDIFDLYNFTIDENTPDDQEVSVDPEMLGKVFENLLEDNIRKGQGAFYTPREIVHYMCQESLINYLSSNSKIREEKIRRLIKKDGIFTDEELQNIDDVKELEKAADTNIFLDKNEAKLLNELLKNIKVVDPACGSGAFLVGMLHEIVYARSYLYGWFLDVSKNMEYILKKETIQNCLYGVDIDPGAIDIAKLRFWLSVIVDENIEDIEPLPNLDYKLMQGNSLLEDLVIGDSVIQFKFDGSKKVDRRTKEQLKMFESNGIQGKLILDESETLAEKLEKYHTQYFNITDPGKKKLLKKKIDNIEDELIQSKCQEEISHAESFISSNLGDSKKILKGTEKILAVTNVLNKWSKDHLRPFFPWKLHFSEVFYRDNPGFDIVIANPPYVNAIELKKTMAKDLYIKLKEYYLTARGTVDLYVYFIEKGINLLTSKGVLAYITPNKYLSVSYGKALREFLYNNTSLITLVDYSNVKVFTEASIYPVVSIYSKDKRSTSYNISIGKYLNNQDETIFKFVSSDKLKMLNDFIWSFLLNDSIDTVQKIISQSVPLSQSGKINATSTTAEADSYSKLINNVDGVKLINTGTIDKYLCLWGEKELTNKGKKYLEPLLRIDDAIVNKRRYDMYKSSKIIFAKIALQTEAFYDEFGDYSSLNTNCIYDFDEKYDPKYILAWVNSKAFQFLFNCFFESLKMSKGYLLYSSPNLLNMYIKEIPKEDQREFVTLVDKILDITRSNGYTTNLEEQVGVHKYEKQINELFYVLYGLTKKEIRTIEGN